MVYKKILDKQKRDFAKNLDKLGANLILTARSEDKLKLLASQMNNAVVISGDLSKEDFPKKLYDEVQKKNLKVDLGGFPISSKIPNNIFLRKKQNFLNNKFLEF